MLDKFHGEDLFARDGADLSAELAGGKVVVPGPDGRLMTTWPPLPAE
jgi:hypothetical protein